MEVVHPKEATLVSPGRGKVANLIQTFAPPTTSGLKPSDAPTTKFSPRAVRQEAGYGSPGKEPKQSPSQSPRTSPSPPPSPHFSPSPRSGPLAYSAPSDSPRRDRPRSRSGGGAHSVPQLVVVDEDDVAAQVPASKGEEEEKEKTKENGNVKEEEGESESGSGSALGAPQRAKGQPSPRSVGGKEWEWKRKALAGKGIVREGVPNGADDKQMRVKLPPLSALLNTIETDRVLISSKSDTWKTKALTGRGIVSPSAFSPTSPTSPISPSSSSSSSSSVSSASAPLPATPAVLSLPTGSVSQSLPSVLSPKGVDPTKDESSNGGSGSKKTKQEKRASRREEKEKEKEKNKKNKIQHQQQPPPITTEVSLPTTVVNRVHVDKDNIAQDMDGVLRALRDELNRLDNQHPQSNQSQPSSRGGPLRRHRRSKSIDQLASHQTLKPTVSPPKATPAATGGQQADGGSPDLSGFSYPPATARERPVTAAGGPSGASGVSKPAPVERKTKTNSLRQQLLLGKGVVKPQEQRTVPVSRLSVLIDMADMQAINHQASILEAAARSARSSPSPAALLSSEDYKPTKEELVRQRLKTVKAVIASAMDELQYELLHQRNGAESSGEDQLLVLGTKLDQLNDLLL